VLEVNSRPVLAPIPVQTNFAGVTLVLTNSATDPDIPANHLTYSLGTNAPAGASLDPSTGVFKWTLPGPNGSFNQITINVTDDGSPPLSDSQILTVVIEPASAPQITSIQVLTNHTLLTIKGTPSQLFWIQQTPTLNIPSSWTSIGTNTMGFNSLSQFEDTQPANLKTRFYRLAVP
jgi:hypothetical protein